MNKLAQGTAAVAALMMAVSPALAAPAKPSASPSAAKLSIAPSLQRVGAPASKKGNQLFGASTAVIVVIVAALAVGLYFIIDDDDDAVSN